MDLLLQANAITAALKRGERVESCPPQLEALFHPSVQTFWISSLRYDPREEIRKVRVPILVVSGDNDLQVPPDNAEALAKAQPRARKAIIAGMTHPLKNARDACASTRREPTATARYRSTPTSWPSLRNSSGALIFPCRKDKTGLFFNFV